MRILRPRDPQLLQSILQNFKPWFDLYFRPAVSGLNHIPSGSALLVGNHSSGLILLDAISLCFAIGQKLGVEHIPYGLAHDIAFKVSWVQNFFTSLGALPASHSFAEKMFKQDKKILVYPGGDIDAFRSFWNRNKIIFGHRRGYLKLAIKHHVPIVPVVTQGAHNAFLIIHDGQCLAKKIPFASWIRSKVWPLALSIPWGLTLGPVPPYFPLPTKIQVKVLKPIRFRRWGDAAANDKKYLEECHLRVSSLMQRTLDEMAQKSKSKVKG